MIADEFAMLRPIKPSDAWLFSNDHKLLCSMDIIIGHRNYQDIALRLSNDEKRELSLLLKNARLRTGELWSVRLKHEMPG